MQTEEIWKDIGTDGRYQVSNLGNVRSCVDYHGKTSDNYHLLKPRKGKHGYLMVILHTKDKKSKRMSCTQTCCRSIYS